MRLGRRQRHEPVPLIAEGTPDSYRSTFTVGDVPSGDHQYHVVLSRDSGRDDLGSFDFNIQ